MVSFKDLIVSITVHKLTVIFKVLILELFYILYIVCNQNLATQLTAIVCESSGIINIKNHYYLKVKQYNNHIYIFINGNLYWLTLLCEFWRGLQTVARKLLIMCYNYNKLTWSRLIFFISGNKCLLEIHLYFVIMNTILVLLYYYTERNGFVIITK